jgi:hypothetical protein
MKVAYIVNGKEVTPEEFRKGEKDGWLEPRPTHTQACRSNKPRLSESTGVMPSQVKAERKKLQKLKDSGQLTGVDICDNGAMKFTSNGDQGATGWQRYRGNLVNFDGGFGETYTPDDRFGTQPE